MDAAPLELGGLRVLVLVDHVLVDREVHQPVDGRLLPRLAERREVLAGVAVEQQLVGDDRVRVLARHSSFGKRYFGAALARSLLAYTESFKDDRTVSRACRVTVASQRIERSQPLEPTVHDDGPARIVPIGGCAYIQPGC